MPPGASSVPLGHESHMKSAALTLGLSLVYTATLIFILSAVDAQQRKTHKFEINFEYRIF
jgi:hypothetical protein